MFRSEDMTLLKIYLQREQARQALIDIGNEEFLHFKDLQEEVKQEDKLFTAAVLENEKIKERVVAMARKLEELNIPIEKCDDPKALEEEKIEDIKISIEKAFKRLNELEKIKSEMDVKITELKEIELILTETEEYLGSGLEDASELTAHMKVQVGFVPGVISRSKGNLLKKVLVAMRRNVIINTSESRLDEKSIFFIIFAHGESTLNRIKEMCMSLGARIIDPADKRLKGKESSLLHVSGLLSQLKNIQATNVGALKSEASSIAHKLFKWEYFMEREIKIYKTMNYLKPNSGDSLTGEVWIVSNEKEKISKMVDRLKAQRIHLAYDEEETKEVPPTFIKTNEFTQCFQDMINVFGYPRYKEINSGLFNVAFFPLFFGSMFGDLGHGLILVAVATFIILKEKQLRKKYDSDIALMIINGRFAMLTAGIGACYFGLLYSEFFSVPIPIFGSQYEIDSQEVVRRIPGKICPFGMDPIWHKVEEGTDFLNNFKMKLSVSLGFFHMFLGLILCCANSIMNKDMAKLCLMDIPKLAGFLSFVGYMIFLIFFKWVTQAQKKSLINALVGMYTSPTKVDGLYPYQMHVQLFLACILIISIPMAMFCTPLYKILRKEKITTDGFLHYMIDGVEFAISLISHTSSYLRIWAVSLAHFHMSNILFTYAIKKVPFWLLPLSLILFIAFTIALPVFLEGISTLLHSLRLNWVEFNSRFYAGDGYIFNRLNFSKVEEE